MMYEEYSELFLDQYEVLKNKNEFEAISESL